LFGMQTWPYELSILNNYYVVIVIISAVKRLKYLIAINRIYVIVNSKLIAINRNFLSILNVPSFIYFFHHFILTLMPLSTWKSGLACFKQMFYLIENQHCQTGRYKIKLRSEEHTSELQSHLNLVCR